MDFELTNKPETVTTKVRTLRTGLFPFKVAAINPDMVGLKDLGIDVDKEPVYTGSYEQGNLAGKDFVDIKFLLKIDTTKEGFETFTEEPFQRLNFRITKGKFISSSMKTQYINTFGRTCWSDNPSVFNKYFDPNGVFESAMGLEGFCKFIASWCNKSDDQPIINKESFDKLMTGDVSSLRRLLKKTEIEFKETGKPYVARCLQGVTIAANGNAYNQIFNKHFCKHHQGEGWMRKFVDKITKDKNTGEEKQHGAFSTAAYPVTYSYDIEIFDEDKAMRDIANAHGLNNGGSETAKPAAVKSAEPAKASQSAEDETDDLPFS